MSNKDKRRDEMIEKMKEYILTKDYESLKMEDIAKIMGISRVKLHQYFSSKDEIVEAVFSKYRNDTNDINTQD